MPDDRPAPPDPNAMPVRQRLETTKLTPLVALAFFCALAAMCGAAALIGHWVHGLKQPAVQRVESR